MDSGIAYLFSLIVGMGLSEVFLLIFNLFVLFVFIFLKYLTRVRTTNYIIILYLSFLFNSIPIILKLSEKVYGDIFFYLRAIFILFTYIVIIHIDNKYNKKN